MLRNRRIAPLIPTRSDQLPDRLITQLRGPRNQRVSENVLTLVRDWAAAAGLKVSQFVTD